MNQKIKIIIVIGILAIIGIVILSNTSQEVIVRIPMSSGLPNNPTWSLSESETEELKSKLVDLPSAEPLDYDIFPGGVYIGCMGGCSESVLPYASIKVESGVVEVRYSDGKVVYYQDIDNIEGWIYDLAHERGYEIGNFSSNYTTANIYKPYSDPHISVSLNTLFSVTVEQDTELYREFIIVNMGKTKQLKGTITIPEFLTIDKNSFSIPPSKSRDDPSMEKFTVEVNTSKPRQIIGEIVVKSNAQNENIKTIPVNFTIFKRS